MTPVLRAVLVRGSFTLLALVAWLLVIAAVLWNWPGAFWWTVTALGRVGAGVRLTEVEVNGQRVPVLDGAPDPDPLQRERTPVLLLHGWGACKEAMLGQMLWLSPSRRVVAPDLPGFGDNPLLPGQPALDADGYIEWIDAFRRSAGLGQVDLIGESMGGALAAAYAAAHPEAVRRLVLEAPAGLKPPRMNALMTEVAAGGNPLDLSTEEGLRRVVALCFVRPPPVPTPLSRYLVARAAAQRDAHGALAKTMLPFLLDGNAQRLGKVTAPTLVLYGSEDQVTDPSLLGPYLRGIRGARGQVVPGAGHSLSDDAPEVVHDLVVGFLEW